MSYVADTLQVGDACVEIIRDDDVIGVLPDQIDVWQWVVSVPDHDCVAYSENGYIGAFDDEDLTRPAVAAAEKANSDYHERRQHATWADDGGK